MKTVYVDNNATTKIDPAVLDEMMPCLTDVYGNPSSMHHKGEESGKLLTLARRRVASMINAKPDEIIFTSCGTESNNTAIRSALRMNPGKNHIVTTMVEHPAIKTLCENLEREGCNTTFVPVDRLGRIDMDTLLGSLTEDTAVVSVMWANNETGTIFPIREIAKKVKERGIFFHTDAVQAVGKIPVDVNDIPFDMLSLSGHKLHAPKGVGALYVRDKTRFTPFLIGGHQEHSKRGGTENLTSIVGLGKACELAMAHMAEENTRVKKLRDKLERELVSKIPKCFVNGDPENRLPNTTSISFEFIEGEAILLMMNEEGICASSGSACTSGSLEPSHVLRAMGVPFTAAHGTIRFSLCRYNTEEEVNHIIAKLPPIIAKLRSMSPFWTE